MQVQNEQQREQMQSALSKLTERFVQTLPDHISAFDEFWDLLSEPDQSEGAISEIGKRAHKLHGQAGSFGFPRIGALAAQVEKETITLLEKNVTADTELLETLLAAMLDEIELQAKAA